MPVILNEAANACAAFLNDGMAFLFQQLFLVRKFLFIYILSIGAAWVLHVFVEKPSGIFAKTKRLRDVIDYYKAL